MRNTSRIVAAFALAGGIIFAAVAAYGWQASAQETSFDSNLTEFMKRSDSSLLTIIRLEDVQYAAGRHLEEYSIAASNPALYRHLASVDRAYERGPAADMQSQTANIEVIISSSQTRAILQELDLSLSENNQGFDIYSDDIEIDSRHYTLALMIPK